MSAATAEPVKQLTGDQYLELLLERQAAYVADFGPGPGMAWAAMPLLEWFIKPGDELLFTPPAETPQPKRETQPRVYRSAVSLRIERDALAKRRDAIAARSVAPDVAAARGEALGPRRTHAAATWADAALRRFVELDQRVQALDDRIVIAEAREAREVVDQLPTETAHDLTSCGATAARCVCVQPLGHDGPHACDSARCSGSWTGNLDGDDFQVVTMPGPRR